MGLEKIAPSLTVFTGTLSRVHKITVYFLPAHMARRGAYGTNMKFKNIFHTLEGMMTKRQIL